MAQTTLNRQETGFGFTEEGYARRYAPDKFAASAPSEPSPQSVKRTSPLHGGGNSFMRSRRRRLAAAAP
jgi:hypothetical protein